MTGVWNKVQLSLRRRGVAETVRMLLQRGMAGKGEPEKVHPFDARYGTDTGGVIGGVSLGAGHPHDTYITAYAGMPPSRFEATIERWMADSPSAPFEAHSFIDIGCGKGRVLLLASRLAFARVVGVELDPALTRTAQANLVLWQHTGQAVTSVEIIAGDATEYQLPAGPCLLYLANSFGAPVLRRLLEKLEERGTPDVDLIYQNPEHRAVFDEFPTWRLVWDEAFPLSQEDLPAEPVYRADDRCVAWRRQPAS